MKNGPRTFLGPPPARTSEFFFAPGGLQEHSGDEFLSVLAAPWGPLGPQVVPGGLPEVIYVIFGTIWASFLHRFWLLLQLFSLPSWDLRDCLSHSLRVMFLFLFAGVLVFALWFWKASKPEVGYMRRTGRRKMGRG